MRDDERIEMYYKFGLLDWKNEQQPQKMDEKSTKTYFTFPRLRLVGFMARIIRRYRTL